MKQSIFIISLFFSLLAMAAEERLNLIQLHHRHSSEVIKLIQPLLAPSEKIIADGNRLIIKAPYQRYFTLRKLIEKLDRPTALLRITVKYTSAPEDPEHHHYKHRYKTYSTTSNHDRNTHHQITVNSGQTALISQQQSIPVLGFGNYYYGDIHFSERHAQSALLVTAFLQGKTVKLTVQQQLELQPHHAYYRIHGKNANTTITLPLGKWHRIGGVTDTATPASNTKTYRTFDREQTDSHIYIRVDIVN